MGQGLFDSPEIAETELQFRKAGPGESELRRGHGRRSCGVAGFGEFGACLEAIGPGHPFRGEPIGPFQIPITGPSLNRGNQLTKGIGEALNSILRGQEERIFRVFGTSPTESGRAA